MTKPGGEMLGRVGPASSTMQGGMPPPPPVDVPKPFLPRSENAARFISRSSKIDPRYVDLELVGVRHRRRRSFRRVVWFSAGVLVMAGGLAGGASVLFHELQPSGDRVGRAASHDASTASRGAVGVGGLEDYPDGQNLAAVQHHDLASESSAKTLSHVAPPRQPLETAVSLASKSLSAAGTVGHERQDVLNEQNGVEVGPSGAADLVSDTAPTALTEAGPGRAVSPAPAFEPAVEVAAVSPVVTSRLAISGLGSVELLAEGQRLLKAGDVKAARLYFAKAADKGLARAALAMGSTFDEKALSMNGLANVKPDRSKALSWYRRAHVLAEGKRAQ